MADFKGGRISLDIDGISYSARAGAKIDTSGVAVTSDTNQDGSMHSYVTPKLISLTVSFDRGDPSRIKWNSAMMLKPVNASFTETDARLQHLMTGAVFNGTPSVDTDKGEVSGLSLHVAESGYQQLAV